ncbi:MAG: dihydrolipoyllysine-residue acetyltransferase [Burkholderiaceae bacterium]|nr:dihydrolipoyllysine-residue acetyltransferase [Burkholderiaceae bacterium]
MAQQVEVKVPDIGDFKEVEVIELLVKPGDAITKDQSLITVESDKASMEIPSSAAGIVKQLMVKLGDKVSKDSPLLMVDSDAEAAPAKTAAPTAAANPVATVPPKAPASSPAAPAPAAPAANAPASPEAIEITVPDIGDFKEVEVIELLVKPGDAVAKDQSLITVESDKASMEIPSSHAGVIKELRIKIGDKVSKGTLIATATGQQPASAPQQPAPAKEPAQAAAGAPAAQPVTAAVEPTSAEAPPRSHAFATEMGARPEPLDLGPAPGAKPHASPSVRKFARELGVDLAAVRGSAPKGRITEDDVRSHVKATMAGGTWPAAAAGASSAGPLSHLPAWPQVDFAKFGPVKRVEMSRIRRISGPALTRNWVTIPHVTNHDDADITELEAFRVQLNKNEKSGKGEPLKLTMLAFLIRACVAALKKFPEFNSSIDAETGDAVIFKEYFHIGFAADTPNGLVVPVVKDADKKGVIDIAQETAALAAKARDGKLSPTDMQGGTFSISSLGGIGGTYFTPIINAPEVAILGVCRSQTQPVWDGKQFAPRLILPLSLSWDHRVVDGAGAARFNAYLAQVLADFRRVLL